MMALREEIDVASPAVFEQRVSGGVFAPLDQAEHRLAESEMSPATAFMSSLRVLPREGLEAILVLAAISSFVCLGFGVNVGQRISHVLRELAAGV